MLKITFYPPTRENIPGARPQLPKSLHTWIHWPCLK